MSRSTRHLLLPSLFALAALLFASPATADYRVTEKAEGDTLAGQAQQKDSEGPLFQADALEAPDFMFFIPRFSVNLGNPSSTTTLLSVRNEAGITHSVEISYYPTDSSTAYASTVVELDSKETYTANVRDVLQGVAGLPADPVEGWIQISGTAAISVDHFIVTPDQAFATGDTAVDLEELCASYKVRYLIGGGFSGGTQINFFIPSPQGTAIDDPPSAEVEVYDEAGNLLDSYFYFTDDISSLVPADLFSVAGTSFGTMDITFLHSDGGFASVTHDANNLYSVGLKGYCLEFATAEASARNPASP